MPEKRYTARKRPANGVQNLVNVNADLTKKTCDKPDPTRKNSSKLEQWCNIASAYCPLTFVKWRPPPRVKKKRDLLGPQEYRCSSHPEFQTVFQNHKVRTMGDILSSKTVFQKIKNCRYNTRRFSRKCQGRKKLRCRAKCLPKSREKEPQRVGGCAKRSATTMTTRKGDRKQLLVHSNPNVSRPCMCWVQIPD
jgi:hypothetical protein